MEEKKIINFNPFRMIVSLLGIVYVWSLPLLAYINFAEKGGSSISGFIANPPATGAMASISFVPFVLMWEFQDYIIYYSINKDYIKNILYYSLTLFQFFYSLFLICTVGIVPDWLHTTTVIMFSISFILHSIFILIYIKPSILCTIILLIGILSFVCLLFVSNMWFWACECIGYSSMLLFTPIEWYITYKQNHFLLDSF
tara:strand:+ start:461 stop:1057 length:597 start_codon:yes stop_codon:yes gene_type:complete